MLLNKKNILLTNTPLRIVSLALGYMFWFVFSGSHTSHATLELPLTFYNASENTEIHAPETVRVQLAGKKIHLRALNLEGLAIHIDAQKLQPGEQLIDLSSQNLLLPESIKLVHYVPSNIQVNKHKKHAALT